MSSISRVHARRLIAECVAGVNAFDQDAIVATDAVDAPVNDDRREFRGKDPIRSWVARRTHEHPLLR